MTEPSTDETKSKTGAMPSDDGDLLLSAETATTGTDEAKTGASAEAPAGDGPAGVPIDRPRLTPQGRAAETGEDSTDPAGGARQGQGDPAEG